ncbi:uncharacterized protein LAESUDRAFT_815372 [Laetiporus sulphureus 93-53]|uniref:Uncharacterized protein n=1 Tax=Laetiporus sulphureus 93-53 TaxID=1314785 RepID=A0A165C758_9APHY|nr:uncharacterized protein LAESUDRAFT_815372 [Laetiporus sulphureus 93-53]KZT02317.1 hypothetical protein LAESUDRAFT_815372 [Laetiporus sulphureus 93-53]
MTVKHSGLIAYHLRFTCKAFCRWKALSDMDILFLALRYLVVGVASALLAIVGMFLSVVSAVGHAIPCLMPLAPPPIDEAALTAIVNRGRRRTRSPSTVTLYSVSLSRHSASSSAMEVSGEEQPGEPASTTHGGSISAKLPGAPQAPPAGIPVLHPPECANPRAGPSSAASGLPNAIELDVYNHPLVNSIIAPEQVLPVGSPASSETIFSIPTVTEELTEDETIPGGTQRAGRAYSSSHGEASVKRRLSWLSRRPHISPPRIPRTDPYQAPYFFPTPQSPEAADYVRQVKLSRAAGARVTMEQYYQCAVDDFMAAPVRRGRSLSKDENPLSQRESAVISSSESVVRRASWAASSSTRFRSPRTSMAIDRRSTVAPAPTASEQTMASEHPAPARQRQPLAAPSKPILRKSPSPPARQSQIPVRVSDATSATARISAEAPQSSPYVPPSPAQESHHTTPPARKSSWKDRFRRHRRTASVDVSEPNRPKSSKKITFP